MPGGIASFPSGVQAVFFRGSAVISTNSRVKTSTGNVMLATDVMQLSGLPGTWFLSNQRVFVNGVPTIGQTSVGVMTAGIVTIPMIVVQTDPRVSAM